MPSNRERCLAYLGAYAARNLAAIEVMLADGVNLSDWDVFVRGKAAVLEETRKNFAAVRSLQIVPMALYDAGSAVAAELQILVDGKIKLRVVDIIEFEVGGRIVAIRAYKGGPEE